MCYLQGQNWAFRVRKQLSGYPLGVRVYETHLELTSGATTSLMTKLSQDLETSFRKLPMMRLVYKLYNCCPPVGSALTGRGACHCSLQLWTRRFALAFQTLHDAS